MTSFVLKAPLSPNQPTNLSHCYSKYFVIYSHRVLYLVLVCPYLCAIFVIVVVIIFVHIPTVM